MLYRKCAAGEDIAIYFGSIFVQAVRDARSHPSRRYVVWANGSIALETDNFNAPRRLILPNVIKSIPQ